MVARVSSLLKTVKNVEDEAGRGVRSLENTIDSIDADVREYDSQNKPKVREGGREGGGREGERGRGGGREGGGMRTFILWQVNANPEDLIRSTKGLTPASAKAVSAGNSCRQADVSACANLARKAITDLLQSCKSAAYKAEKEEDRDRWDTPLPSGLSAPLTPSPPHPSPPQGICCGA